MEEKDARNNLPAPSGPTAGAHIRDGDEIAKEPGYPTFAHGALPVQITARSIREQEGGSDSKWRLQGGQVSHDKNGAWVTQIYSARME